MWIADDRSHYLVVWPPFGSPSLARSPPRGQGALHEPYSLRDLISIPQRAVLIIEQNQLARRRGARGASRIVQQHQRQQSKRLWLQGRQQLDEQPAQTN